MAKILRSLVGRELRLCPPQPTSFTSVNMRIEHDIKLDFKDVLIRPKRSTLKSRSEVRENDRTQQDPTHERIRSRL